MVLQVAVLNQDLLKPDSVDRIIDPGRSQLTWSDIDGQVLDTKTREQPSPQLCRIHAHYSVKVLHYNYMHASVEVALRRSAAAG